MLNSVNRLRKNKEFNYIYKKGKYINSSNFSIHYVDTYLKHSKIGISVGKKVGNSVMRSRAKRVMSEVVRLNLDNMALKNYCIVLKEGFVDTSYQQINEEFITALKRAKLFKESDV